MLRQSSREEITTDVLHSVDAGNHTCTVMDHVGHTGNATIEIQVSGLYLHAYYCMVSIHIVVLITVGVQMYLFDDSNPGTIPNNSILLTNNFGQIPRLQCISGSTLPDVGQWISPSAEDVALEASSPFDIIAGGEDNPGYLNISLHSGHGLTFHDQGVYTCLIPDETGMNTSFSVGIYLPAFLSM